MSEMSGPTAQGVSIMARTQTVNPENGTEDEDDDATNKRERVDLESLQPHDKVQLNITIPAELKLAIIKTAEESGQSASNYVRGLVCQRWEYSLPESFTVRRGRQSTKYAGMSPEEKKAAIASEAKANREKMKRMLAALEANPELAAQLGLTA
jgi:hypothetical protein